MGVVFLPVFVGAIAFTMVPVLTSASPFVPLQAPSNDGKQTAAFNEIDVWRAAYIILNWYGYNALTECTKRAEELDAAGDTANAAVWRRIIEAVRQLANTTPSGPLH
jgi:hypothetical protein